MHNMTIILCSEYRPPIELSTWGWRSLLAIAVAYGWRATGTRAPLYVTEQNFDFEKVEVVSDHDERTGEVAPRIAIRASGFLSDGSWTGSYTASGGQLIPRDDAAALAAALSAFVEDAKSRLDVYRDDFVHEELCEIFAYADGRCAPARYQRPPETLALALEYGREIHDHLFGYDPRTATATAQSSIAADNLCPDWVEVIDMFRDMCAQGEVRIW